MSVLVGSGGVLRHAPGGVGGRVLDQVLADHAGGWRVPVAARRCVDTAYLLFAVGLLAEGHPRAAEALAAAVVAGDAAVPDGAVAPHPTVRA